MTHKYTLSKKADKDIEAILIYTYREFGECQALKYTNGLAELMRSLAQNPKIGRTCGEIKRNYRRFEYESHVIFYRPRKDDIFIIRVLHKHMDMERHL